MVNKIKNYRGTSYLGMGQVQNGRLYIRYRSSSQKQNREVWKAYKLHSLAILILNLLYKFCWEEPNTKILILFTFFLITHNSKNDTVYATIIHTKLLLCWWRSFLLVLSCVWVTTGELWPQNCLEDAPRFQSNTCITFHTILVWRWHVWSGHTQNSPHV